MVKLYHREASARVSQFSSRGVARPKNQRNAGKAELFEDALSRVSRTLAAAARRSAAELRAERIDAARRDPGHRTVAAGAYDSTTFRRPGLVQHQPLTDDRSHPEIAGTP
jgi:hypothetical protein